MSIGVWVLSTFLRFSIHPSRNGRKKSGVRLEGQGLHRKIQARTMRWICAKVLRIHGTKGNPSGGPAMSIHHTTCILLPRSAGVEEEPGLHSSIHFRRHRTKGMRRIRATQLNLPWHTLQRRKQRPIGLVYGGCNRGGGGGGGGGRSIGNPWYTRRRRRGGNRTGTVHLSRPRGRSSSSSSSTKRDLGRRGAGVEE